MKPTIICLTPVRNESWILDRFLKATSLWADYIIIADQMSTDGSREIARKYPKVILVDNPSEIFNEPERQRLLIHEARKIEGPRLLITLDADEIFTPNVLTSPEWQTIMDSKPGIIFKFQLANFRPDLRNMWNVSSFPLGYMDDGYEHKSTDKIHSSRIPLPCDSKVIILNQIKVIHFQFTSWQRMRAKHRWYQALERIHFPYKSAVDIFRTYHHMYSIPESEIVPIPDEWINDYNKLDIDITSVNYETINWFEKQSLDFIEQYGAREFRKINIWDVNWQEIAYRWEKIDPQFYKDPRNMIDKCIQSWLLKTQPSIRRKSIERIDKIIKRLFNY
jgi:hypothetical protein